MVMRGETICTGAPRVCKDCGRDALASLYADTAIRTMCDCGAYTRESDYCAMDTATAIYQELRQLLPETDDPIGALRQVLERHGVAR